MLATFKAKDDLYLAGFGRLRLSEPVYIKVKNRTHPAMDRVMEALGR